MTTAPAAPRVQDVPETVRRWTCEEYAYYVELLVHRVLAQHRPHEKCDECPAPPG